MSDYGEQGATPVDDAVVDDPPTVDEVLERQRQAERDDTDDGTTADAHDGHA